MNIKETRETKADQVVIWFERYRRNFYLQGLDEAKESFQEYIKYGGDKTFNEFHEIATENLVNEQVEEIEQLAFDKSFLESINSLAEAIEHIDIMIRRKKRFIKHLKMNKLD